MPFFYKANSHDRIPRLLRAERKKRNSKRALQVERLEPRIVFAGEAGPAITSLVRDTSQPGFHFVLTGTGEPGAAVEVKQAGLGSVGQTAVDAAGNWRFRHENAQLANGSFRFLATTTGGDGSVRTSDAETYQPNFVIVDIDDMREDELPYMQFVHNVLANLGTRFTNSFVPTALSGPSRASMLTGLYAHNTGVLNNVAPLGGVTNSDMSSTIATWLDDAGYRTGYYGKKCDGHTPGFEEPYAQRFAGWDEWHLRSGGQYYNWVDENNGEPVHYGHEPEDYATDVLSSLGAEFIRSSSQLGDPFYLHFAPTAAHATFIAAPRHDGVLNDVQFTRPPSYATIPEDIPLREPFDENPSKDDGRRRHLETLLALDEGIEKLYRTLEQSGQLDNTVFIVTSDHGLLFGEHSLTAKQSFHEEAIRVPLVYFDGRTPLRPTNDELVLNIDLAPTMADLAGAATPRVDGKSLVPTTYSGAVDHRLAFLLEQVWSDDKVAVHTAEGLGTGYSGVRTRQWKYIEYQSGHTALFDLLNDPYELDNIADQPERAGLVQRLSSSLASFQSPDTAGPTISSLDAYWELDGEGHPFLRLEGSVSDALSGNSEVRSPEAFFDIPGLEARGIPLEAVDGVFSSVDEPFRRKMPFEDLASLKAGEHTIYVRGRDTVGNWGAFRTVKFTLGARPVLNQASDTGASAFDGLTVDHTPTFFGRAPAGSVVRLYVLSESTGLMTHNGTATAGASGVWSSTLVMPSGSYHVFTATTVEGESQVSFGAAKPLYVAAARETSNLIRIEGTDLIDQIVVDANNNENVIAIYLNGVLAGGVPKDGSLLNIKVRGGDDAVTVLGNVKTHLDGGSGDDFLSGGAGPDVLDGGTGTNVLSGGPGDDRYVFQRSDGSRSPFNTFDQILELEGGGFDTLDFSRVVVPIIAELAGSFVASHRVFPLTTVRRRVTSPAGEAHIERLILGLRGGTVRADTNLLITSMGGDRVVNATNPVAAGGSALIRSLSANLFGPTDRVRLVLKAPRGVFQVAENVAEGLSSAQILGNGSGHIRLNGTVSQINRTLQSPRGLAYFAPLGFAGKVSIVAEIYSRVDQSLLQKDLLNLDVV